MQLLVDQPDRGYRYSVDSLVLAAHVATLGPAARVLDVGSGVGVVGLLLAAAGGFGAIEGIELQPPMYEFSQRNLAQNTAALSVPVTFCLGDVREWRQRWTPGTFDRVVSNPPFFKLDRGHPSPDPVRRVARQEVSLSATELLEAAAGLLTPDGLGVFLYPIQRGFEVAATARALGLHVRRRAVRSFEHSPPYLAIVEVAHRAFEEVSERVRPLTLYDAPHVHRAWLQTWVDLIRRNATGGD